MFQEDGACLRTPTGLRQLKPLDVWKDFRENTGVGAQGHTVKPKYRTYYTRPTQQRSPKTLRQGNSNLQQERGGNTRNTGEDVELRRLSHTHVRSQMTSSLYRPHPQLRGQRACG